MSHAAELRDPWLGEEATLVALVQELIALGDRVADRPPRRVLAEAEQLVLPGLDTLDRAIVRHAVKLSVLPRACTREDVARLQALGLDDRGVHDVVMVAACFAFMNRLADGLGVSVEPRKHAWATTLYGRDRLRAHLAWGRRPGVDPSDG